MARINKASQSSISSQSLTGKPVQKKQAKAKGTSKEKKEKEKPLQPQLSGNIKSATNQGSGAKKKTVKNIKQQAKSLMSKIRKKRQYTPSAQKSKAVSQKKNDKKSARLELRQGNKQFVPRKTVWFKNPWEAYGGCKVLLQDDCYFFGKTPEDNFQKHVNEETKAFWKQFFDENIEVLIDLTYGVGEAQSYYPKKGECFELGNNDQLSFLYEKNYSGYKKIVTIQPLQINLDFSQIYATLI